VVCGKIPSVLGWCEIDEVQVHAVQVSSRNHFEAVTPPTMENSVFEEKYNTDREKK
jgi:hypothetical protein